MELSDGPERPLLRFLRVPVVVDTAVHALVALAAAPPGTKLKVREICDQYGLSRKFVAMALNELRIYGVVDSRRGAHGGFWLTVPPSDITLADVFDAVDLRTPVPTPGFAGTLDLWAGVEAELRARVGSLTIADAAQLATVDAGLPA